MLNLQQDILFPAFATRRDGWIYCGWISRKGKTEEEFNAAVHRNGDAQETRDGTQERISDIYADGAVFYCRWINKEEK